MARIIGVEIPGEKRIDVALCYIYGIGQSNSTVILQKANIDPSIRAKDLNEQQLSQIVHAIQEGKYAHTELPRPGTPGRRVDVADMYNEERFRPRYEGKLGDPMLLVGLGGGVPAGV